MDNEDTLAFYMGVHLLLTYVESLEAHRVSPDFDDDIKINGVPMNVGELFDTLRHEIQGVLGLDAPEDVPFTYVDDE